MALHWFDVQHLSDNSSYRRDFSIYRKEDVLFQLKIRGASEKFKNQPRHLLRPTSVNFCQYCRNLFHETVPLNIYFGSNTLSKANYQSNQWCKHSYPGWLDFYSLDLAKGAPNSRPIARGRDTAMFTPTDTSGYAAVACEEGGGDLLPIKIWYKCTAWELLLWALWKKFWASVPDDFCPTAGCRQNVSTTWRSVCRVYTKFLTADLNIYILCSRLCRALEKV